MASSQQQELALLENVLFRLAMEKEEGIEKFLSDLLTPLLGKVNSPYESTRNKVVEILTHLNKRITSPTIKLPMDDLIVQFQDKATGPITRNFDLIYLEMGIVRLTPQESADIGPRLLVGVAYLLPEHRDRILLMSAQTIPQWVIPDDNEAKAACLPFRQNDADCEEFLTFALDILLLPPSKVSDAPTGPALPGPMGMPVPEARVPPGMSEAGLDRLLKAKRPFKPVTLLQCKLSILKIIARAVFRPVTIVRHLVVAAADPDEKIQSLGEDNLRRMPGLDFESSDVVDVLLNVFLGSQLGAGRLPASAAVRTKILTYLCRSRLAANRFPLTLKVIFESMYGTNVSAKMTAAGMTFVHWVFMHASDEQLAFTAPVVLQGLVKYIKGYQDRQASEAAYNTMRQFSYSAMGQVARRVPSLFTSNLSYFELLMSHMALETGDGCASIQEGLTMMCPAYANLPPEAAERLKRVLVGYIDSPVDQARYMAVYYAVHAFPFNEVGARWVCMLLTNDRKLGVKDMASRGLKPYVMIRDMLTTADGPELYPDFQELVRQCDNGAPRSARSTTPEVLTVILNFIGTTFVMNAARAVVSQVQFLNSICDGGAELAATHPVAIYQNLLETGLLANTSHHELHRVAASLLLRLISLQPPRFAPSFKTRLGVIKGFLGHTNQATRESMARLVGIIIACLDANTVKDALNEFVGVVETRGVRLDLQHGTLLGMGHTVARTLERGSELDPTLLNPAIQSVFKLLTNSPAMICAAAAESVGAMARQRPLPIPDGASSDGVDAFTKFGLVKRLLDLALKGQENKVREKAVLALGYMTLGEPHGSTEAAIVDGLMSLGTLKHEELQFYVGDALVCVGSGRAPPAGAIGSVESEADDDYVSILGDDGTAREMGSQPMGSIMERLLVRDLIAPNNAVRQAACVWLLCLVKFAGQHAVITARMMEIQRAFGRLLADRDEFTQEVASRGLGVVYDMGSDAMKQELLGGLVKMLNVGKSAVATGEGDGELFNNADGLGSTPDGASLNTYKDLCAAANDMGQPDLIYRFMSLASHNAVWNSKKGAAFGISSIAAKAGASLEQHLPTLVPKLYRYQYDPNVKVQEAMKAIWVAMVAEPKKALEMYFPAVVEELLSCMGNRMWRVRQASALALVDLLPGQELATVEPYLEQMWTMSFRTIDDIKETVRMAGLSACRAMGALTLKFCDPTSSSGKSGEACMAIVLPFLLKSGIVNNAEPVQKFSIALLQQIVKTAGFYLKPHLPELVVVLLESISSFEPQQFNYVQMHAEKHGVSQEQLEGMRVAVSKSSPLTETLELCLREVDGPVLENLVPQLAQVVRSGVGLATKVGASRIIVQLTQNHPAEIKAHAAALIKALKAGLSDRSMTVRKSFASAIGNVALHAKKATLAKLMTETKDSYLNAPADDVAARVTAGVVFSGITKNARAIAPQWHSDMLPLAFIAMHDVAEEAKTVWRELWEENTPGTVGGLRLYLNEICTIICDGFKAQSWLLKRQCALSIVSITKAIGNTLAAEAQAVAMMRALNEAMAGRLWEGKEDVVSAYAALCVALKELIVANKLRDVVTAHQATMTLLAEVKKKNKKYKRIAIQSLDVILENFPQPTVLIDVLPTLMEEALASPPGAEEKDKEGNEDPTLKPLMLLIQSSAFSAIGHAFAGATREVQAEHGNRICRLCQTQAEVSVWNVKLSILATLKQLIETIHLGRVALDPSETESLLAPDMVADIITVVAGCIVDNKYATIRTASLDVVETLLTRLRTPAGREFLMPHRAPMTEILQTATQDKEPSIADRARTLLQQLP